MSMTCESIVNDHLKYIGENFSCHPVDDRLWIVSPYSYPDGDLLEIAVADAEPGQLRVSDLGETLRHLSDLGFDPLATPKGEYLFSEILKRYHAEYDRGQITKKAAPAEVGAAVQQVLMACYSVAHLLYLARASSPATFAEEMAHLMAEERVRFESRHKETGLSGTTYEFEFLVRGKRQEGLMVTLSPATPSGTTAMVNATFRKWADMPNGRWHGTIMDDRHVNWRPNDVSLLKNVSELFRWSEQETLRRFLKER